MPYRDELPAAHPAAPAAGIIDDMVRQFADPYAFLRELVQNGIDAGATHIDVHIDHTPSGQVRTTVADDGTGMSRATIEGPLLTLFESSKENDATKIGKYGIGFISVFAISPTVVEVVTWRAGESWILRLFGDHSYELAIAAPREGHGTEVTLVNDLDGERLAAHEQRCATALTHWCRHALVPIVLTSATSAARAINEPFTVPGALVVTGTEGDVRYAVGVGGGEGGVTFAGFYNRGLTLLESTSGAEALVGIRFKVESPRLAHTLSRDDIRRDESYADVLGVIERVVRGPLIQQLAHALTTAAGEAATGPCDRYLALLQAATWPKFPNAYIHVPLVDRLGSSSVALLTEISKNDTFTGARAILVADQSTAISKALTAAGRPVVRHARLAIPLAQLSNVPVVPVERAATLITAVDEDPALTREIERLAASLDRHVAVARFATFEGQLEAALFRLAPMGNVMRARAADRALLPPYAGPPSWGKGSVLFLNVGHELVRLARRRAKTDVRIAGHLLFRALLLDGGAISERDVDVLLMAAVSA